MYRKRSGLTVREVGRLIGYKDGGQIVRHEASQKTPRLAKALAYEVLFQVPLSAIFAGMHEDIRRVIEHRLRQFESDLENRTGEGQDAKLTAQKLVWLTARRSA